MTRAVAVAKSSDQEKTAERLLKSSAGKFYDPEVDIDWDAPLLADKVYQPEHRISLYGTPLWETMTPEQRIELGKHEIASIASIGIWFEVLLMQMLLKDVYSGDPTSARVQFSLTEIADECRHSTMFAKFIKRVGVPAYWPRRDTKYLARFLPLIARGPARYAAILVAEEILDRMQRDNMADAQIQPLIRMVNRIHVLEEARHVTFAREEIVRGMAGCGPIRRAYYRFSTAVVAYAIADELISPQAYRAVGLNPRQARRQARENPHFKRTMGYWGERILGFLDEAGLVGGLGKRIWRRSALLGK